MNMNVVHHLNDIDNYEQMPLTNRNKKKSKSSSIQPPVKQVEDPDLQINMFDSDDVSITIGKII